VTARTVFRRTVLLINKYRVIFLCEIMHGNKFPDARLSTGYQHGVIIVGTNFTNTIACIINVI